MDAAGAPTTLANGVFSVNSGVSSRLSWKLCVFSVSTPPSLQNCCGAKALGC